MYETGLSIPPSDFEALRTELNGLWWVNKTLGWERRRRTETVYLAAKQWEEGILSVGLFR